MRCSQEFQMMVRYWIFFSDIPLNISNFFNSLELEDDLSNFQSYLRDISDFENYTAKKRLMIFLGM